MKHSVASCCFGGEGLASCLLTAVASCFYNPFFSKQLLATACLEAPPGIEPATKFPEWDRILIHYTTSCPPIPVTFPTIASTSWSSGFTIGKFARVHVFSVYKSYVAIRSAISSYSWHIPGYLVAKRPHSLISSFGQYSKMNSFLFKTIIQWLDFWT